MTRESLEKALQTEFGLRKVGGPLVHNQQGTLSGISPAFPGVLQAGFIPSKADPFDVLPNAGRRLRSGRHKKSWPLKGSWKTYRSTEESGPAPPCFYAQILFHDKARGREAYIGMVKSCESRGDPAGVPFKKKRHPNNLDPSTRRAVLDRSGGCFERCHQSPQS